MSRREIWADAPEIDDEGWRSGRKRDMSVKGSVYEIMSDAGDLKDGVWRQLDGTYKLHTCQNLSIQTRLRLRLHLDCFLCASTHRDLPSAWWQEDVRWSRSTSVPATAALHP